MITIMIEGKNNFTFYIVVSVRKEFWVSPWLVSHAENVIRGAYDDCDHFILIIIIMSYCQLNRKSAREEVTGVKTSC